MRPLPFPLATNSGLENRLVGMVYDAIDTR
jgi:hypothetical protein